MDTPCNSLDLALEGAQRLNSAVVVLHSGQQSVSDVHPDNSTYQQCVQDFSIPHSNTTANKSCPAWSVPANTSTGCRCGSTLGGKVVCNEALMELKLLSCNCMTDDEDMGLIVGACSYNCYYRASPYSAYRHFYNISKYSVNGEICDPLNRMGRLCGQCKEGFSPPVYSYDLRCVKCNSTDYSHYNWVKYIAVAFVPLTIFYIVVVAFRISATSPPLSSFVHVAQMVATPGLVRIYMFELDLQNDSNSFSIPNRLLFDLYGVWNLDFFRTLIPPICLPVDTLSTIAMDYAVALYPLVLIVITYIFIELHAHNCRQIVLVWKPFHWCLARFRRQWNMKTSIVDAFATFLLLSYVKLLNISFDLLVPTWIYNINGTRVSTTYLFYDATIEVFSRKHLPYAIVTVLIVLVFIILPLVVLLLYPLRMFQSCLNHCHMNSQALRTFINAFQGPYKDGTNGTRDCRYFAAVILLLRICALTVYAVTLSGYFYFIFALILLILVVLLFTIQPFKQDIYNKTEAILFLIVVMFSVSRFSLGKHLPLDYKRLTYIITFISTLLPLLYVTGLVFYWMYTQSQWLQGTVQYFCRNRRREEEELNYPDRLLHPEHYNVY